MSVDLLDLDSRHQAFLESGLEAGIIALGAVVLVAVPWRLVGRRPPVPVAGLAMAGAALVALHDSRTVPDDLWLAAGVLAASGLIPPRGLLLKVIGLLGLAAGGWLVAGAVSVGPTWLPAATGAATVAGGWLTADMDRRWQGRAIGPALVAGAALGILVTVPDTEEALVLAGAVVPMALASWPVPLASLGRAGAWPLVGLMMWTVAVGGDPRTSAVIGGQAALGLLAVEPVAAALGGRSPLLPIPPRWWLWTPLVVAGHGSMIYVVTRVGGLRRDATDGALIIAITLVGAVILGTAIARSRLRRADARPGA